MIVIVQPWFSAVGHPAQSLINLAKIIGNHHDFTYLISMMQPNNSIEVASRKLKELGSVIDYQVKTESIREGTVKALIALRRLIVKNKSIDKIFFLDAHLVLLAALWPFYANKNIKFLGVVYLMGPERITRYQLIRFLIERFLKRKEVVLFLRTNELVFDWKNTFPNTRIQCLPSLEIPFDEQSVNNEVQSSDILRLGVFGQIRSGKSLEWLVPIFKKNPSLGQLVVVGDFSQPVNASLKVLLKDFEGFRQCFITEHELLELSSQQDYLLMLYDNWDPRMEGAIMFLAARVHKPVITYEVGWCGRMVNTYNNGLFAPKKSSDFVNFIRQVPKNGSMEYQILIQGVIKFREAHSGDSIRRDFFDAING
jgi:hypothetical protein